MDERLKEAIAAVRTGDKVAAQQQLAELLDDDPQQVQGWYLLSLLVDSPQKQAAYLSKTLALNPDHKKAKEQLAALQAAGTLAPSETSQPMDVLTQSETDQLPDWLREADGGSDVTAVPAATSKETAVPPEELPDWLKEPADMASPEETVAAAPTSVDTAAEPATKSNKAATEPKKAVDKPRKKQTKTVRKTKQSTRTLNILLGVLVTLAVVVMILLAYLLLS